MHYLIATGLQGAGLPGLDPADWVASRDASKDQVVARRKLGQDELARLLQHTYRVLLTRGMKGTFVYSTDYETRDFLRTLV